MMIAENTKENNNDNMDNEYVKNDDLIRKYNPLYGVAELEAKIFEEELPRGGPIMDAIVFLTIGGTLLLGEKIRQRIEENAQESNKIAEEAARKHKNPFSFIT